MVKYYQECKNDIQESFLMVIFLFLRLFFYSWKLFIILEFYLVGPGYYFSVLVSFLAVGLMIFASGID
jgi:hypothetical protein